MEQITKRTFFAEYANKRDKRNILGAAIGAYLCAALSLGVGVLMQNYFIIVDVVLIVGPALGIQLAQSRVCAVLLLVYACINTILGLIGTGQLSGWLLILVGVWAISGTVNFNKDYQSFLRNQSPLMENPGQDR